MYPLYIILFIYLPRPPIYDEQHGARTLPEGTYQTTLLESQMEVL